MTDLTPGLPPDRRLVVFERMLVMRRLEESVALMSKDHPFGHFHLYIGQEATGAAVIETLRPDDLATTTHRNHGHIVGRGVDEGRVLAEILGRADGTNGGRGGTLHVTDRSKGFLSTSAVVGGSIGLGTGAAHGLKRQGNGAICATFFGDGALEEGIAFEAMNIAALWKLPVLYVCENNSRGALGARAGEFPTSEMAAPNLSGIPESLGIQTAVVDGADPEAVFAAAYDAVGGLRQGDGPFFLEARTERWPGSRPLWPELSTGETDLAMAWEPDRIAGDHAAWIRDQDPVLRYARTLTARDDVARADLEAINRRISERMAAARHFAAGSPWPDQAGALDLVFAREA
jgi:pyruvate dehydrogenase E1 component alpha subunit